MVELLPEKEVFLMKKQTTALVLCTMLMASLCTNVKAAPEMTVTNDYTTTYSATSDGYTSHYSNFFTPDYYVFTTKDAEEIIDELGIEENLQTWGASITVLHPQNGTTYEESDLTSFIDLIASKGPTSNIKVIGIDEGATFVNNYVSQNCWAIAGIFTYGGEMAEGLNYNVPIPAYLVNPTKTALDYYIQANDATQVDDTTYRSETHPLHQVIVGSETTLKDAFQAAWDNVFSKNYRQQNETTEFYMSNPGSHTDPYPIYEIYDMTKIQYNEYYNEPINGEGEYTWFEYIPTSVLEAEDGTVPLVVTLHGNGNDAKLMGDSTGWVELAIEEGFMVVAPEWQDVVVDSETQQEGPNYYNCDGIEGDKLIEWIEVLKTTYPQIDANRIYITGLSAGGSASSLYGVKYYETFAAVAAVSAPGLDKEEITEISENYEGTPVPFLYICGDHDFFGMIPVDLSSPYCLQVAPGVGLAQVDPNVDIFPLIQAYQKINGLEVSETYDLSLNEYYGIALDNQQWIKIGDKDALEGTLSNEDGVIMQFVAMKNQAHWNYKPQAEYIWNFFENYSKEEPTNYTPIIIGAVAIIGVGAFVLSKKKKAK